MAAKWIKKSDPRYKAYLKRERAQKRKYKRKPVVKLVADKLKITKCNKPINLQQLFVFGRTQSGLTNNPNWYHYPLCNLTSQHNAIEATVGDNLTVDLEKRESVRIFHKNSRVNFTLIPAKGYLEPIQYRYVLGYFKGDDNAGTQTGLTNANLNTLYPTIHTRMKRGKGGRNDFYYTFISKTYTLTPKMIYDVNGSDDNSGASETMNAIWLPKTHSCNMICNKVRQFESDEADSLDGWTPFFAIQCLPVAGSSGFNAPDLPTDEGTWSGLQNACPQLQLEICTYFQDIN